MNPGNKVYLGDAVYAAFDGYHVTLTVSNGIEDTETIHLDPHVQAALIQFIERLVEQP